MRTLSLLLLLAAVPAASAQAPAEAPVVLSLNSGAGLRADVWPGGPLVLTASLSHRDAYAEAPEPEPVTVAAVGDSWAGALRVEARDAAGALQAWPLHAAPVGPGPLTLVGPDGGQATFWLAPDEASVLAPGTYTLRAVLDSTALGSPGAFASPRSVPVALTVHGPDEAPDAEAAFGTRRALADWHVLRGEPAAALAVVDAILAAEPDHPVALLYRGALLRSSGRTRDAVAAFGAAAAASRARYPETTEPLGALDLLHRDAAQAWEDAMAFEVTVADKGLNHPTAGHGGPNGFAIDGTPGEDLYLVRGTTYTFRLAGVPAGHPFYLTTSAEGTGAAPYTAGVVGAPATGDGVVTFTPGPDAPALLYYQSTNDGGMGWRLHVTSPAPTGLDEPDSPDEQPGTFALSAPAPNPTAGRTAFVVTAAGAGPVTVEAFDLLGRRVGVLYDGPATAGERLRLVFDTAGLPSGTYVVRATGDGERATRQITVAR